MAPKKISALDEHVMFEATCKHPISTAAGSTSCRFFSLLHVSGLQRVVHAPVISHCPTWVRPFQTNSGVFSAQTWFFGDFNRDSWITQHQCLTAIRWAHPLPSGYPQVAAPGVAGNHPKPQRDHHQQGLEAPWHPAAVGAARPCHFCHILSTWEAGDENRPVEQHLSYGYTCFFHGTTTSGRTNKQQVLLASENPEKKIKKTWSPWCSELFFSEHLRIARLSGVLPSSF